MSGRVGRAVIVALKLGVAAAALAFALHGLDLRSIGAALSGYAPWKLALLPLSMPLFYLPPSLRLRFLMEDRVGRTQAMAAFVLGVGVNNLLPARLGEVAKAAFLGRASGGGFGAGVGAVFWERFFDVQMLLLMSLGAVSLAGWRAAAVMGGMVALAWAFLAFHRFRPEAAGNILKILPEKIRGAAGQTLEALRRGLTAPFLGRMAAYSLVTWAGYVLLHYVFLVFVAGFDLTFLQTALVFVAGAAGMAVPGAPGGLGVYEAAVMAALAFLGVPREEALAAALAMHAVQMIPTALAALFILARTGFRIGDLRRG